MDACVAQGQQLRFMYVLPLSPRRLLIEDTAFARTPDLDPAQRRAAIHAYAAASGWCIRAVLREESGVLPMPWRGMPPAPRVPLTVGYAGGWFHPATGYSAPSALRLAALLARHRRRFRLVLNWLAFCGFRPDLMWQPFARFYHLPLPVIARFCSLQSTALDVARLLVGRPPRGFGSAWRAGQHTSEAGS